jgi:RHS repeat-associated protein
VLALLSRELGIPAKKLRITRAFAWNYNNWLTNITGTATSTYWYDHAAQRVLQIAGGATTSYPSPLYSLATTSAGRGTTTEYIFAGSDLVATFDASTSSISAERRFIHADHLGSTNVVSDNQMAATQVLDYMPYGATRLDSGTDVSQREFIGQFFDEASKMSYLNARYYDNGRGQFLSQDPVHVSLAMPAALKQLTGLDAQRYLVDPQLLNSYSYGRGNPIVNKDPQGNFPLLLAAPAVVSGGTGLMSSVMAGVEAGATFVASDMLFRNSEKMRYIPFDSRRLPPSHLLGPENPLDVKPPNFDGGSKWIVGTIAAGMAADGLREFFEPLQQLEQYLKRQKEIKQMRDGQGSSSNSTPNQSNTRTTNVQSTSGGSSQSGGVSLSGLRAQLESALSKLKSLSGRRNNN